MAAPASDPESASEGIAAPGPFLRQAEVTTAHPHPRTRSTHFPFLSLPAEVRVMIYGYLLVLPDEGNIRIVPKDEGPMFSNPSAHCDSNVFRNQTLNILMVNKLIYAEAAKEFYSGTHFNFGRGRFANGPILACQTFLIGLSPNMLACIKSIEIVISMPFPFQPCLNEDVFRTLINILNFFLPAFDHLTLNFYGTCPDIRRLPWHWPTIGCPSQKWLGVLLTLRKRGNLHIHYNCNKITDYVSDDFDEDVDEAERLGGMVAFVSFLRTHLLRNADNLANRNIRAHQRHWASFTLGRWKRKSDRVCVVECHDDENGNSLLPPLARSAPRQIGILEKHAKNLDGDARGAIEDKVRAEIDTEEYADRLTYSAYRSYDLDNEDEELGLSETEDWDLSDDGDRDSLNGEDLSGIRTTFTRDENYLETYAQPPGQP
ncbi:hypothetical protein SLS55_000875 [Diplodia seriata]|uniref:Uncharacterized protein n=1 Tax=Diplodia seriata TaxID=420778 RepID=A0ABR3CVL1_9PEZI